MPETSLHLPLKIVHLQAANHIRYAAKILSDAIPYVANLDRQFYPSVVSALYTLEQNLDELNQILNSRN